MKKILLIEDDDSLRDGISLLLLDEGYQIKSLPDGSNFQRIVSEFKPDLYLIDYRLPGKDGLEITKIIRSSSTKSQTPVILLSATGDNLPEKARIAGANEFVRKPFNIDNLIELIQKHLRNKNDN
jgi:DNA-binding response OmpR family regulator